MQRGGRFRTFANPPKGIGVKIWIIIVYFYAGDASLGNLEQLVHGRGGKHPEPRQKVWSSHAPAHAAPFVARLIESALKEVDIGVIEAAKSFGASDFQIIFKVMLVEALPAIISAITLTLITVIGFSAMAGAVGGGGLGDVAIKYGYYRFQTDTMIYTVIILIALVQSVQSLGDYLYKKTKK